jgi:hypothetical protein
MTGPVNGERDGRVSRGIIGVGPLDPLVYDKSIRLPIR